MEIEIGGEEWPREEDVGGEYDRMSNNRENNRERGERGREA